MAFRPNSPKLTRLPDWASPGYGPYVASELVRFGCSMDQPLLPATFAVGGSSASWPANTSPLKIQTFTPMHAVGGHRLGEAVVDIGPQGVQRHAALPVPLAAGDLGAVRDGPQC